MHKKSQVLIYSAYFTMYYIIIKQSGEEQSRQRNVWNEEKNQFFVGSYYDCEPAANERIGGKGA